jgi:hypothetical protein
LKQTVSHIGEDNLEMKEPNLSPLEQRKAILAAILGQRAPGYNSAQNSRKKEGRASVAGPGGDSVNESRELIGLTSDALEKNQVQFLPYVFPQTKTRKSVKFAAGSRHKSFVA